MEAKDEITTNTSKSHERSKLKRYEDKLSQLGPWRREPPTIHRVPSSIRAVDKDAYEPTLLSIGPYHRSKPNLQAMEEHKWHSLRAILHRNKARVLRDYLDQMETLEEEVRSFYSESIKLESNEFVEMMLLDGCFIIELFLNAARYDEDQAADNNPIHSTNWILPILCVDMLLLENQIPFVVLQRIFKLVTSSESISSTTITSIEHSLDVTITSLLALRFFDHHIRFPMRVNIDTSESPHHLLHLYHLCLISNPSIINQSNRPSSTAQYNRPPLRYFPSATDIQDSGIKLELNSGSGTILDVEFKDNALRIPPLYISHSTNSVLRNLIALEQSYPSCGSYFTSFAIFMNCLIDTPQDVQILKRCGIIEHWFGSDDQVAALFTRMCVGVSLDFYYCFLLDLFFQVKASLRCPRRRLRATMVRNYFKDRMALINFQITITVTILTVVQTFFAVISSKRD